MPNPTGALIYLTGDQWVAVMVVLNEFLGDPPIGKLGAKTNKRLTDIFGGTDAMAKLMQVREAQREIGAGLQGCSQHKLDMAKRAAELFQKDSP